MTRLWAIDIGHLGSILWTMKLWLLALTLSMGACGTPPAPTPQRLADGSTRHWPLSVPVAVGSSAEMSLYTHCGFNQALIDFAGRLWMPITTPVGVGNQAPTTYANPIDDGTITLIAPEQAAYLSATAHMILLRPRVGPQDVAPCY